MKNEGLIKDLTDHYDLAVEDLNARVKDFDTKDELFRTWLDESTWPYEALIADPRVFTTILEKTSRLIANDPRSRLIPRGSPASLIKAEILNMLLQFQWQEHKRGMGRSMIETWSLMDMNARKYGSAFGLCPWLNKRPVQKDGKRVELFDGPVMQVLSNRDCLPNPSYSYIKNWFQFQEFMTLKELEDINYGSSDKFIYKNLDKLEDSLKDKKAGKATLRDYSIRNKEIKGIPDQLGKDPTNRIIKVITELREDRLLKFCPDYGVVIMDIKNPYDHYRIPIVHLRYYVIDDDIYGLSEIEPIEKLARAINALASQYLDAINCDLFPPLMVNSNAVQMHTLEYGANKLWLMNEPGKDVIKMETGTASVSQFTSTYSFLVSALMNATGGQSLGISNVGDFQKQKTATEVSSLSNIQNARDNFNRNFLAEAVNEQMELWLLLDRQFIFSDKDKSLLPLRVADKDAIKRLQQLGLDKQEVTPESLSRLADEQMMTGETKYMEEALEPVHQVDEKGVIKPKFTLDDTGEMGTLLIEPEDFTGAYDFVLDINSFGMQNDVLQRSLKTQALTMAKDFGQEMAMEGYKVKYKELLESYLKEMGFKDAESYFERVETQPAGVAGLAGSPMGAGNVQNPGMGASNQATPPVAPAQPMA